MAARKPQGRRELIQPHPGDKRYIRRDDEGHFTKDWVDLHRSLSADDRRQARRVVPEGQGNRGDERRRSRYSAHRAIAPQRRSGQTMCAGAVESAAIMAS